MQTRSLEKNDQHQRSSSDFKLSNHQTQAVMEPQNIYESLHHNAVFETDQISPSTKRGDSGGRNGGKMFTNHGLDRGLDRTDDHSYEVPSNTSILSTQKTPDVKTKGMTRDNELYESCAQDIMAAQDANIRRGIRELAISSSAEHNNSSLNCALVFCMLVLLLASIASSSYVFYQYEIQRTHSCISNDQSKCYSIFRPNMIDYPSKVSIIDLLALVS